MIRAVCDTNVLVSSFLSLGNVPARIRQGGADGLFLPCLSTPLYAELRDVLSRPTILERIKVSPDEIEEFLDLLSQIALWAREPLVVTPVIEADPDDDVVLATASATNAQAIVSGDAHLLQLKAYANIPILSPRDFLTLLETGASAD